MGLFAHPDDEVFCMGGTIAAYAAAGATSKIVSLTRGEAGQIRAAGSASRATLGEVRERELARAASVLGVDETECFGFGDGTLADRPLEPMVEAAIRCIDDFVPDVVISFGDDGAYGHPDHIMSSQVALQAARSSRSKPMVLQAVFPRTDRFLIGLLVDWLEGLDERFGGSEEFAHALMLFANGSSMLGYAADHIDIRFYPAGTFIVEQGEPPGELFMVLSGRVDVVRNEADGSSHHLACSGPGSFIGEDGIARGQPRNANVIAKDSVTCFVLSPGKASLSAGRGQVSTVESFIVADHQTPRPPGCIEVDVRRFAAQKLRALSCHRSQYALDADMFPKSILEDLFGVEYFVEAPMPAPTEASVRG